MIFVIIYRRTTECPFGIIYKSTIQFNTRILYTGTAVPEVSVGGRVSTFVVVKGSYCVQYEHLDNNLDVPARYILHLVNSIDHQPVMISADNKFRFS